MSDLLAAPPRVLAKMVEQLRNQSEQQDQQSRDEKLKARLQQAVGR